MLSAIRTAVIVAALAPSLLAAQNCKKGIPCGHSCISASKVCHIQSTPTAAASDPAAARGLIASPPPAAAVQPSSSDGPVYPFIGSFADGVYFLAGCAAALDLAPDNRRYFTSEAIAVDAGYRRSRVLGC